MLFFLLFLLGPSTPVRVVHSGVLKEGGEHKDEAHDQVDVNGFDVGDSGKGRPDSGGDGGHGEDGGDSQRNPGTRGFVVDPEGDPRQHDDQDGGKIGLEDEVANVALQLEG